MVKSGSLCKRLSRVDGGHNIADLELDLYAGYTRTIGSFDFDFSILYYIYPDAYDPDGEFNYWELKVGANLEVYKDTTMGLSVSYAPEYSGEVGENWIVEATIDRTLSKTGRFSTSLTGSLGCQYADEDLYDFD